MYYLINNSGISGSEIVGGGRRPSRLGGGHLGDGGRDLRNYIKTIYIYIYIMYMYVYTYIYIYIVALLI